MTEARQQPLKTLLLTLLPSDHTSVSNGTLLGHECINAMMLTLMTLES